MGDVSLALGYQLIGRRESNRWRHSGAGVALLAASTLRPGTTLLVNLGHAHSVIASRQATNWGVALEQEASATLTLVAEAFGDDHSAPSWAAGLRWNTPVSGLAFGLIWGETRETPRIRQLNLGLTWTR